ncbi:MAG: hypothetical protein IKK64_00775 [Bacteroidales bacterium]|nr:hypothetical protein [Bacteroidales bacterium]
MDYKIELTELEDRVLKALINRTLTPDSANDEEYNAIFSIVNKAGRLMMELNVADEIGDNVIGWFYDMYVKQSC